MLFARNICPEIPGGRTSTGRFILNWSSQHRVLQAEGLGHYADQEKTQ
jgi:hypothetical protein